MLTSIRRFIRKILPKALLVRIYRWQAKQYINSLSIPVDTGKKTLLALNHFFDQDLRALEISNRDYNFVKIDTTILFKGAKIHFSPDVQAMRVPYESEHPANRKNWYKEAAYIYDLLDNRFHMKLIITPADCYYWIREFIEVARHRGIKTIVINKEGTVSPEYFESESARIRNNAPFLSDHLFVWSERQRSYWNRAGVSDDFISVIGQPRSDLFFLEKKNEIDRLFPKKQPLVTFFSYMDDAYIPVTLVQREGLSWRGMKKETHEEIARLANKYRQYNFIIKTHPQQPDLYELQRKYSSDNLRVIGGASTANELIQRSVLIIAFQTTAIIEAMFLNKRVIYTFWDKNIPRLQDDLLPFHKASGIRIAYSLDELRQMCERTLSGDMSLFTFTEEEQKNKEQFVREYLYRPDGQVCQRLYQSLTQFI